MDMEAKRYTDEELKKLKSVEVEILLDLIRVCEKYSLNYFIAWGSLIGAVRHKGFIPWDDDLDIGMFREDYDKLEEIFDKELSNKYCLMTPLREKKYASAVTKIMKKGTTFIPSFGTDMKCFQGIGIDIFIFDKVESDFRKAKRRVHRARMLSQALFLCGSKNPTIKIKGIVGKIAKYMCIFLHNLFKIIPNIESFLYKMFLKNALGCKEDSTYVTSFQGVYALKYIYKKEEYFPMLELPFENISVKAPKNYDKMLKDTYGDYMKLPPEEERVNHCAVKIDFGDCL